jgi:hypothetical protein
MFCGRYIFGIGTPVTGVIKKNWKSLKQIPKYQEIFILSFAVVPGQYTTAFSFYGVPGPALIGFVLDKTPKFIHVSSIIFSFTPSLYAL